MTVLWLWVLRTRNPHFVSPYSRWLLHKFSFLLPLSVISGWVSNVNVDTETKTFEVFSMPRFKLVFSSWQDKRLLKHLKRNDPLVKGFKRKGENSEGTSSGISRWARSRFIHEFFCFFLMYPHTRTYEMNYVFMMTFVRTPWSDSIKHHVSVCKDLL